MGQKWLFIIFLGVFLGGCASNPREELQLARRAVAQAYDAGAPKLAPSEYQAAAAALQDAENLVRFGNYKLAQKVLPYAATHGFRATFKAREERVKLELAAKLNEQKKKEEEEEKARLAKIEADKKKKERIYQKRKPRTKPKSGPPLLTRFEVRTKQSLWSISERREVYNDPLLWPAIYKANRDQIKDPRQVFPGQVLTIPRRLTETDKRTTRKEARESDAFQDKISLDPSSIN